MSILNIYKPQYSRLHFGYFLISLSSTIGGSNWYFITLQIKVHIIYSINHLFSFSLIKHLHNSLDYSGSKVAGRIKDLTTDSTFHDKNMVPWWAGHRHIIPECKQQLMAPFPAVRGNESHLSIETKGPMPNWIS